MNAFTVDVEDGINLLMRDIFSVNMKPTSRVIDNTIAILELLQENNVRGTFFILGEVAEVYPELIKRIAGHGHEIGVHGYTHKKYTNLTRSELRNELKNAKDLLETITGKEVIGHRAPAFSINKKNSWALNIIAEEGFIYDSSIMPVKTMNYGWSEVKENMHRMNLHGGQTIIEVPLSVSNLLLKKVPACGGGYLRYFPFKVTYRSFRSIQKNRPVIVYLHPYELDVNRYPDFFYQRLSGLSLRQRIPLSFYRYNKHTVKEKLLKLLSEFNFMPIKDLICASEKMGRIAEIDY